MPLATKESPARPFDIADAIRRAARCRALRQSVGLTVEELANIERVTVRSIHRWENAHGAGSTPDDVLTLLASLLDAQRTIATAVTDACAATMDHDEDGLSPYPRAIDPAIISSMIQDLIGGGSVTAARGRHKAPVKGGQMSYGAGAARALVKEAAISGDVKGGAISDVNAVTVLYYPSQSTLDSIHPKMGVPVGVVNTTARMIADELDRAGIDVEWRYASAE